MLRFFLLFFIALSVASAGPSITAEYLGPVRVHKEFPSFGGYDLDGNYLSYKDVLGEHKIIIVSYFATWCAPCKRTLPIIEKAVQSNEHVTGVYIAVEDDPDAVRQFAKELNLQTPIILDKFQKIANRHGVAEGKQVTLPRTFILDEKGIVRVIFIEEGDDFSKRLSKIIRSI